MSNECSSKEQTTFVPFGKKWKSSQAADQESRGISKCEWYLNAIEKVETLNCKWQKSANQVELENLNGGGKEVESLAQILTYFKIFTGFLFGRGE